MTRRGAMMAVLGLVLCAAPAGAAPCPADAPPPTVTVSIHENSLRFESDMTRHDMAALRGGVVPAAAVGGMMAGEIALFHDVVFARTHDRRRKQACVWMTHVNVRLVLDPVIYIAQDLQQNNCWYQEIYRHELLHVAADRAVAERYRAQIPAGMALVFDAPATYMAAVPEKRVQAVQGEMRAAAAAPLGVLFDSLMQERVLAQRAVDTPEEYERVAAACADEALPPLPPAP